MIRIETRDVCYYSNYSKTFLRATWHYRIPARTHGLAPNEHPSVWDDRRLAAKPLPEEKPRNQRREKGEIAVAIADAIQDGPKTAARIAAKVGASQAKVNAALEHNKDLFRVSGQTGSGLIWGLSKNKTGYCFGDPEMERKPRASDWTQADEEQLYAMASRGYTIDRIATELGRSALAVKRRGQALGVYSKRQDFWLDSEIVKLRELAQTHTYEEAAVAMGRTTSSVSAKAKRLGVSFLKTGEANPTAVYSTEDIQRVFELREKMLTLKEISAETGMHFSYVADILNYETRYRDSMKLTG